ncbi:MAG: MATE family efflux transporter [bacterium]|nr:MATE family efflux transporter [bacterium]
MSRQPEKQRADYTEGSIIRSILKMGIPSMFGFLSQNIYSLVDTYWVAQLPEAEAAVAGVTFYATILWAFFSFNQLVGPGSVAVISRRYGEKEYDRAETAIKETLLLKLGFGFFFGVVGYFSVHYMLFALGARGEALDLGSSYGQTMFLGMGIMYATYSVFTAMRGIANPSIAMILMIGSNLLNLILDPLFIFGYLGFPALGINGAAVASVISYSAAFSIGIFLFATDRTNVALHWRSKVPVSVASMWHIMKIGIPSWAGSISYSGARLIIMPMVATFGTPVVAAYGVGNQVNSFGIMILVGIGLGLSSLIGHNIGSNKLARAKKTADQSILLGVAIMVVFGLGTFIFSKEIMGMFFDTPETLAIGSIMLRVFAVVFPFWGAFIMIEEVFAGVGKNKPAMAANIVTAWVFQVIPIFAATKFFHATEFTVWCIMSASGAITSIAFYFYYRRGTWLAARV